MEKKVLTNLWLNTDESFFLIVVDTVHYSNAISNKSMTVGKTNSVKTVLPCMTTKFIHCSSSLLKTPQTPIRSFYHRVKLNQLIKISGSNAFPLLS